ncbi:MAG: hypothetical protein HZA53_06980 [Planctomycetes bacterium]|nr:hypothetical protein [Planctomycetota bacterium]
MGDLNKDILRWVLLIGTAPVWWPFLRTLWRDFNDALREEGGLFGRRPSARELERIQRERAASTPTLTHEPWAHREAARAGRSARARTGTAPKPAAHARPGAERRSTPPSPGRQRFR